MNPLESTYSLTHCSIVPEQENWEILERISQVFNLTFNSLNEAYHMVENKCFQKVLEAYEENKWSLIQQNQEIFAKITDITGRTLFMRVMLSSSSNEYNIIVERFQSYKDLVLQRDVEGNDALQRMIKEGAVPCENFLEVILRMGIEPREEKAATALHLAILHGRASWTEILVRCGANIFAPYYWASLKMDPCALSVAKGQKDCFEILVEQNRQLCSVITEGVGNLLHVAIYFHQTQMIPCILEKAPELIEAKNSMGLTPLACAAALGEVEAIALFIEKEADVEAIDNYGRTALHHAAKNFQIESIAQLVIGGAKLNACDSTYFHHTPLTLIANETSSEATLTCNFLSSLMSVRTFNKELLVYFRPENLVFKGGGPKGIAYVGVIEKLEELGYLSYVKRVAGTSAGAITATLLSMGYDCGELKKLLKETNLMQFLDHPLTVENVTESIKKNLTLKSLYYLYETIKKAVQEPLSTFTGAVKKLYSCTGLCEGKRFREWIEKRIKKKTKIDFCTFGELRKLITKEPGKYKHLHVFAVKIGKKPEIVHFSSEDEKCDSYIISEVIGLSMSIPGIFKPGKLYAKIGENKVELTDEGTYVDGGVLYNLPIEVFDEKRYQISQSLEGEQARFPKFNKRTIGFDLHSEKPLELRETEQLNDIGQLLQGISSVYFHAEDLLRQLNPYNESRLIKIDPGSVTTLHFNLSDKDKDKLIETGKMATHDFFETKKTSDVLQKISDISSRNPLDVSNLCYQVFADQPLENEGKEVLLRQSYTERTQVLRYFISRRHQESNNDMLKSLITDDFLVHQSQQKERWYISHEAAAYNSVVVLRYLFNKRKDFLRLKSSEKQETPMYVAVCEESFEAMEFLYSKFPEMINETTSSGENLFHGAVYINSYKAMQWLNEKAGHLLTQPDKEGKTPIRVALNEGCLEAMQSLFELNPQCIEEIDKDGNTLLHLACYKGNFEIVKWLIQKVPSFILDKENKEGKIADDLCVKKFSHKQAEINKLLGERSI